MPEVYLLRRAQQRQSSPKVARVERVAAEMAGLAERPFESHETIPFVQCAGPRHVRERLEVHATESGVARALDAAIEQLLAQAEAPDLREEIHLAELARRAVPAGERREAATARDVHAVVD